MAREVKVGDIVKLKCCPQEMVVEVVYDSSKPIQVGIKEGIVCVWIDDFGKPYREQYASDVLNFVAEGFAEAMFKRKPVPEGEPVALTIDEENIPF